MATSTTRQMCSYANPSKNCLKKQDQTKEGQEQVDQNAMAVDTLLMLPHLPDPIVEKIFRLIPTKVAVRSSIVSKLWASVWSLGVPFLVFDDEGDSSNHDEDRRKKLLFVDFVKSCLKHYERNNLNLDRFKLRMRYDCELIDSARIDEWFSFVVDKCIKELYISIQSTVYDSESIYYRIPSTILNAQYLTYLHLQHVRVPESNDLITLPSLKTMILHAVLFHFYMATGSFWKGCPSIELLSLVKCSFSSSSGWRRIFVDNASLKILNVIHCQCLCVIVEAKNLESFELTSVCSQLKSIWLQKECVKLKYINVSVPLSGPLQFGMFGTCGHDLKATIDIPNLHLICYHVYWNLPKGVISVKARNPMNALLSLHWDDEQAVEPNFPPPMTHFSTWRDFLENFESCDQVYLDIYHYAVSEALAFPENFRRTSRPPLLNVKNFIVSAIRPNSPETTASLEASLLWMAPHAESKIDYWQPESSSSEEDEYE